MEIKKRSQVTIYIIMGIVLLLIISLGVYIKSTSLSNNFNNNVDTPTAFQPVESFIQQCLEITGKDAISFNRYQGGYYYVPEPYITKTGYKIPIYYSNETYNYPTKEIIEQQLSRNVEDQILSCISEFNHFKSQGYEFTYFFPFVNSTLTKGQVSYELTFPVKSELGNDTFTITTFKTEIETNYYTYFKYMEEYMKDQETRPDFIRLSKLVELTEETGIDSDYKKVEDNERIVLFYLFTNQEEFVVNNNFLFAIDYAWEEGN